ncbi:MULTISPECIES: carboxymuconolactone decarboxylase family protein [unclassified Rhizobium]|uniref:carboxymuconolactone decarboxylase family protein n=1 Tax=unclassified Rhizobium TaxID=2613769 RepID=UPI001609E0AB|nr:MULTISPECIES: carboxymuconolactone decarboxylase family protein [unclassified Rhizobium]MCS3742340.1 AhpD family alkylhydroperoxidase [Rhizobium sp. BK661]
MLKWKEYRTQLLGRIGELPKLAPDTIKTAIRRWPGAGRKTNHLDAKQRELIALVVAVTLRCDGCIVVHTTEAKKFGATEAEIAEALGVAISVNTGAALVYSARVVDATHAVTE